MIYKEKILHAVDPVCGMLINPQYAQYQTEIDSEEYYFCSRECLNLFEYDSRRYVQESNWED